MDAQDLVNWDDHTQHQKEIEKFFFSLLSKGELYVKD